MTTYFKCDLAKSTASTFRSTNMIRLEHLELLLRIKRKMRKTAKVLKARVAQ